MVYKTTRRDAKFNSITYGSLSGVGDNGGSGGSGSSNMLFQYIINSTDTIAVGDPVYLDSSYMAISRNIKIGNNIDGTKDDYYGRSVSINDAGTVIAVGGSPEFSYISSNGLVSIYENITNPGIWTKQTDIKGDTVEGSGGDGFGKSVSMNAAGTIVAIGAPFADSTNQNSGQVVIYDNITTPGEWTKQADINGSVNFDEFGTSVSINAAGTIVAIGARGNNSYAGQVSIYDNITTPGEWTKRADINGSANSKLGTSVSMNAAGTVVTIGAPDAASSGQVSIYDNITTPGTWTKITDINGATTGDKFGTSISMNAAGTVVAIGAPEADPNGSGSGQVSIYDNITTPGTWTKITDINGAAFANKFGTSVSMNNDGTIVTIGAPFADFSTGLVSIYDNITNPGTWTKITDINGATAGDKFGTSISMNNDLVSIGSPYVYLNEEDSGQVIVYNTQVNTEFIGFIGFAGVLSSIDNTIANVQSFGTYDLPYKSSATIGDFVNYTTDVSTNTPIWAFSSTKLNTSIGTVISSDSDSNITRITIFPSAVNI